MAAGSGARAARTHDDLAGVAKVDLAVIRTMAQRGEASYIVYLREQADLSPAYGMRDRAARGRLVYQKLKDVSDRTQAPLLAYLATEARTGRAKDVRSFFATNAIGVTSAGPPLWRLAAFPEVQRIILAPRLSIPEPTPGVEEATNDGVEWGVSKVRAPEVWAKGVRGEGVVVATIDTGAQYDHPALVNQYRGHRDDGAFDHNYNWWDPAQTCGKPSAVPCDNRGHGTHVMGTMVGDDGGSNHVGMAPRAKWMACKGCQTSSCSAFALLECGDFVLAPWDLNRANPDPTRRPHVVNNSWAGTGDDAWYLGVVQSWRAAGIFPSFANGNDGARGCATSSSPGDYPESFSSGATDINDGVAPFSSRGPSAFGVRKPDISAPGVNVRSSIPTNSYASFSGTSMASPHTAGMVALLWSFYPGLSRDIANTENKLRPATQILNTPESCGDDGPTTHPNNVFGWGRADALQAYSQLNIYTDRSVYSPGETANVRLSLVSPLSVSETVDMYVAVQLPSGQLLFFPGFVTTPAPFMTGVAVGPFLGVFDYPMLSYTFGDEPVGAYTWFAVLTPPGADPMNPANWLSFDDAPFTKK